MPISGLEHYLSYHLRIILPHVLSKSSSRRVAYLFSLFSAITSGFITLISLYSQPWQTHLHYSSWQINMISSVTNLGMYLTPPILGIIADNHGPITLSCLSILGFIPSYAYLGHIFYNPPPHNSITNSEPLSSLSFNLTLLCFMIIGISTSALYFSALITCTKLYPTKKLLSISLPTTSFGISSLVGSQLLRIPWFWSIPSSSSSSFSSTAIETDKILNLGRVFHTFAWLYVIIGIFAWVATGTVSMLNCSKEEELQIEQNYHSSVNKYQDREQQPLLSNGTNSDYSSSGSNIINEVQTEQEIEPIKSNSMVTIFKDPLTYVLAISMLLSLGPLEMFVTNMSSLSHLLIKHETTTLSSQILSIYAFSSTLARLSTGLTMDLFSRYKISLKWLLLSLLSLGLFSQALILHFTTGATTSTVIASTDLLFMSILLGQVYGGLFTIYPTITLVIYGEKLFGTAYGSLMVAPAIGSIVSCMSYAKVYDSNCNVSDTGVMGRNCISPVYKMTVLQFVLSIGLTGTAFYFWRKRRISF
ncbi:Mch1p NDAI_0D04460 [Naumovozyma dairenensis CBS 421]|uniref:Probable transporter MCH1 n=1 Tax=Naumovozyma dairenensis (strain ATCC 10597 / BCRC 20456 / CBS 421 / NBRC 0211 / NRRL Y-12639) TaxID=1071378 RepID=G0WAE9_NAUDC|nr:hypothetical protein NDAI_0D04460 [Naumovozyma dairenensis CBS 421]CCD24760.1 hypothetical protein NDAI_0D04460 [Naumovozyma dairenensis CBS 421]